MKTRILVFLTVGLLLPAGWAATTINTTNKYAYGANIGWMDCRTDTKNGVVIGEYVCSGYIYAANVGWIHLGSNAPANGIQYQNNSASDYGVNHDGQGNLRGYAYGANIGWINFETNGAPKVDLKTGRMSGFIYSANCGWVSLSNTYAVVQTDTIAAGADSDNNGLPDVWELQYFNALGVDPAADPDNDGMSNKQEYLAGTNPNDGSDKLLITSFTAAASGTNNTVTWPSVTWQSVLTRCYYLQALGVNPPTWLDSGLGLIAPDGATTTRMLVESNWPSRFYRVQAIRPLASP